MTRSPVRHLLTTAATLVTAGALLAGCTVGPSAHWQDPPGGTGTQPGGAKIPAADWRPCTDVAEKAIGQRPPSNVSYDCATVKVPQDWAHSDDGKTFDVKMLRARSERFDPNDNKGSLVINPGGPGGSGIQTAVYLSLTLPLQVVREFDIVGFDPRGVGESSPVECFSDSDKDALTAADPDPATDKQFDGVVDLTKKMVNDCTEKYGESLGYFSTEQTARDMDAIRQAVGDEKLSYLGYSYGTLLGAVYAKLFPRNIRTMVLDGAVDPTKGEIEASEGQAAGFELAFGNFAKWCKSRGKSCPIGPDAKGFVKQLLAKARKSPAKGRDGREATAGWVFSAVVYTMYVQEWWPRLADALSSDAKGNPNGVFSLVDGFNERDSHGHYPNSMEVLNTVNCVDEEKSPTVAEIRKLQLDWRKKYPLFGASLALSIMGCAVFPDQHDPFPYGKADGAPPILVVGTTGDPATPYQQSGTLAKLLGTGILITYEGEGHTAYPKPGCLNTVIDDYLIDEKAPDGPVTCHGEG